MMRLRFNGDAFVKFIDIVEARVGSVDSRDHVAPAKTSAKFIALLTDIIQ